MLFFGYKYLATSNEPTINDGYITASKNHNAYSMNKPTTNLGAYDIERIWNNLTNGNYDKFKTCKFVIHYKKNNETKSLEYETDATCTE